MIIQERISETLVRTYSDRDVYIHGGNPEADYAEAVDPISANRTYTETNTPIAYDDNIDPETVPTIAEALLKMKLVELPSIDEPDYLNEHEQEPDYFS